MACLSRILAIFGEYVMTSSRSPAQADYRLHRTIVMVGMMGCGKTAIGRALAQRLDVPFLDSDAEIETAANAQITEIFARDGEAFFRKREGEVIGRLLKGPNGILSTGGGAFMQDTNRAAIEQTGVSVWLDAPLSLLWDRVRQKDTRPLLRTADPKATLEQLFADRVPIYAKAGVRVDVQPQTSIEETTDQVIATLLDRPDILELST